MQDIVFDLMEAIQGQAAREIGEFESWSEIRAEVDQLKDTVNIDLTSRLGSLDQLTKVVNALNERAHETLSNAEQALKKAVIKKSADQIGGASSALEDFAKTYTDAKSTYFKWFAGTLIAMLAILGATLFLPKDYTGDKWTAELVIGRLAVTAVGLTALIFLARQYSAAVHAAFVTKHRAKTVHVFAELSPYCKQDTMLEALLLTVAQSIFAEPTSPLSKHAGNELGGIGEIVESLKSVKPLK